MIRQLFRAPSLFVGLTVAALTAPALGAPPYTPSRGDVVPSFQTMTVDGKARSFEFPEGSETVFLFFLSGCPSCHKMIPEWNRAYQRKPEGLNVVGVIMDQEPPGFWSTMHIEFPVVRSPGRQFLQSLNVNRVPLTLRVGEGGVVEDLELGVIDPIRLGELFKP